MNNAPASHNPNYPTSHERLDFTQLEALDRWFASELDALEQRFDQFQTKKSRELSSSR